MNGIGGTCPFCGKDVTQWGVHEDVLDVLELETSPLVAVFWNDCDCGCCAQHMKDVFGDKYVPTPQFAVGEVDAYADKNNQLVLRVTVNNPTKAVERITFDVWASGENMGRTTVVERVLSAV